MKESSKSSFEISNSFSSMLQKEDKFQNTSFSSMVTSKSSSTKNSTNKSQSNSSFSNMYESNLKQHQQNGLNNVASKSTNNLGSHGVDVLSHSYPHQISGNMHNHSQSHTHLIGPDIIVSSKGCSSSSSSKPFDDHHGPMANSHKTLVMHNSSTMMDIKSLQKSSSFTSSLSTGGLKIGSWFDRRARKISMKCSKSVHGLGVVHEHPRIGSDGESEEGSRTSEDVVSPANRGAVAGVGQNIVNGANRQQTINSNSMGAGPYVGVKMRQKNNNTGNGTRDNMGARKLSSQEEINKRLSLPADLKLPDNFVEKQAVSPTLEGPLSRATRRQSLSEIGFGRMDTYTKLDKLGEGTYATVFKGKSRLTDNLVALKEIRLEHEEGAPCTAIREVSLLKDLKHNNIVTLHDIVHTDRALTLVFEYLERDLKQYMDDCGGILSMNNVKIFLFQLIRGLGYCHSRRILHRDLKPQNLLINEMGELKLADFGLARAKSVPTKTYSNEVVTLWYRPPDVLLGSTEYSTPIDMWGVGCIFYEMASGRPLFPGSTVEDELHLIFKVLGTPTEDKWHGISMSEELAAYNFPFYPPEPLVKRAPRLDQDGLDLVEKFLLYEAKKRISARSAMRHPYFGPSLGPAAIENLLDVQSIFTLPGVQLSKDPGYRSSAFNHASSGKSRRQSMLL